MTFTQRGTPSLARILVFSVVAALATPATGMAQFVEDFNAPGAAWESGWLGVNSDLGNYYCQGARGCTDRGNAPTALWPWGGQSGIQINFDPSFGAAIQQLTVGVGSFQDTNLFAYDMSNNLIYNQFVTYDPVFSDGLTYVINSSNGISSWGFTGEGSVGNTNIDNVTVNEGSVTPEPASMALLGTGLVGVFAAARRRRNESA